MRKNITILKTTEFFYAYPIMLFFQHNNLSVKEWSRLRTHLKSYDNVSLLILKNSVIENIIVNHTSDQKAMEYCENKEILQSMFQGPCLAIGCFEFSQLIKIMEIVKKNSKIFTVGAIIEKKILTHLDLKKLISLDNTVYNSLLTNFSQSSIFYNTLQNSLNFEILQHTQRDLISCLAFLQAQKKVILHQKVFGATSDQKDVRLHPMKDCTS
jgi:ribosomal protein L10